MHRVLHNLNERLNARFGPFLRRLLATIGLGALIVAVTLFFVFPQVVITLAESVLNAELIGVLLRVLIVVVVDALLGYLIFRQWQREPVKGLLVRAPGATSELDPHTVERQIVANLARIADMGEVRAEVLAVNGSASITLHVETKAGAVLPQKQKEINRALLDVVERQLGLRLAGQPRLLFNLSDAVQPMAVEAPAVVAEPAAAFAAAPAAGAPAVEPAAAPDVRPEDREDPGMAWMFMDEEESAEEVAEAPGAPVPEAFTAEAETSEAAPESPIAVVTADTPESAVPAVTEAGSQRLSRDELAKLVAEGQPVPHGPGDDEQAEADIDGAEEQEPLLDDNESDTLHLR